MEAMAWMRLEDTIAEHPKIRKLAMDLGVSKHQAIGHMVCLWTWALRFAPDGDLSSFDDDDIELAAGLLGVEFTSLAVFRRLLDRDIDGNLFIHGWMKRAGSYHEATRKAVQRAKKKVSRTVPGQSRDCPDDVEYVEDVEDVQDRQRDTAPASPPKSAVKGWTSEHEKGLLEVWKAHASVFSCKQNPSAITTAVGRTLRKRYLDAIQSNASLDSLVASAKGHALSDYHKENGYTALGYALRDDNIPRFCKLYGFREASELTGWRKHMGTDGARSCKSYLESLLGRSVREAAVCWAIENRMDVMGFQIDEANTAMSMAMGAINAGE